MEANTTWTVLGAAAIMATAIATQWKRLVRIKILVMTTSGAIVNIDIDRTGKNGDSGPKTGIESPPSSPPKSPS